MGFLRSMDSIGGNEDNMGINPAVGSAGTLEHKMRIEEPPPIDPELIAIPPLIPLPNISKELKKLVEKAYKLHGEKILADLAQ